MTDVNQVVDLGAVSDAGDSERGAIDARIRADFNIVADLDGTDLGKFLIVSAGEDKSKSIGAQHAAGM